MTIDKGSSEAVFVTLGPPAACAVAQFLLEHI